MQEVAGLKNKIKRFSNGDFSKEQPEVKFSETNLVLLIGEGETYQGSFTIQMVWIRDMWRMVRSILCATAASTSFLLRR